MLSDVLPRNPVTSVDEALACMTRIDADLPDNDGVKWFNRLYLRVTEAVKAAIGQDSPFDDPEFITHLDVVFANQYFAAAAAGDRDPSAAPSAWRPLFQSRHRGGIARIQFAFAGMNAHINRDLPDGIVQTFTMLGGAPTLHGIRHDDFERVNGILDIVQDQVKTEFTTGLIGDVDVIAGRLDDVAAMWSVRGARAAAWNHAEVLWTLRDTLFVRDAFFANLDNFTGFAGRGLLLPVA